VRADNLAYVLYTSGSTGLPKGVAVTHRNVLRLVLGTDYARFGPEEVFLQLAPVTFDASTLEIWGPLLHGGRLVLPPPGQPSLAEIAATVQDGGVTSLWLTAGLFHQMVDEELPGLAGVRQLLTGGDVVSPAHARAALASLPGTVLIDGYGPTEGTTFSCCQRLTDPAQIAGSIPIGRPIANVRAQVLDGGMREVPLGVAGELYLGGDGLARGYLGRTDLTAERFVPDPSHTVGPGERLYRTGDRVRLLPDGRLDFLGRTDLQVKVAGQRVEPAEVEAALALHPGVKASAVVAREETRDGRRLVAYVVPAEGAPLPGPELRAWLRARLPEAMVPRLFLPLDRLPLTANGKVDRAALPPPKAPPMPSNEAAGEPRTPTAEILAGLWADLLELPRVDPGADFFALGGHSLLGTRLLARVRRTFAVDLPLRTLFEAPTVDALAERIDRRRAGGPATPLPPLTCLPRTGGETVEMQPAALAQRRLWFLTRLAPDGAFLNVAHGLRLTGDLARAALCRSLAEIVARHEPLRTTFTAVDGQPVQRIAPPGPFVLPLVDLAGLPAARRATAARQLARAEAGRPADLERGPLFRSTLLRLDRQEHQLLLVPHHLVFDGASRGVLFRELETLYGALSQGLAPALPPLAVRYADFAAWQQAVATGPAAPALAEQRAWWRERLAGLPALDFPTDQPRSPVQRFAGGFRTRPLPAPLSHGLLTLCRAQGVTLFMALLALFEILLARWSGQADFPVGVPVAGRSRPEVEELIGFFVNTLVLRADLAGEPAFAALLVRTREAALGAYAHQDLPFEVLVAELRPERHLATNPLFDVVLSLDEPPRLPDLSGLAAAPLDLATDMAHFDLTLIASRAASGLALTLNYKSDLYEAATAERLLEQLATLLAAAVAAPETPIAELTTWSAAAWHQVAREWNDTHPGAEPATGTVIDLVERQAARTPAALALAGSDGRLTYGELDRQANRLAWRLRELGLAAGGRVALCLDRSPELALAALAAWKAGAAYLPLDPAAPPERLALVVRDAEVPLVITRREWAGRLSSAGVAGARVLAVEDELRESAAGPPRKTGPADLAYVIYTSGSTGLPKGVEVSHGSLANLLAWHRRSFPVTPADRGTLVANPAFDASVWELWPFLAAGASVHVPPGAVAVSPRELLGWFAGQGITSSFLPTPLAEEVLRQERPAGLALRFLLTGGDRLRRAPRPGWGFALVNVYGPTEATVVTTATVVPPGVPGPPSIGRPIAGAEVYLLDSALRPVPPGVPGEIAIAGAGLARGYGGRPDLTAERFVPHPFSAVPGARLYRSGDLARQRPGGVFEFLGRRDGQVKVRGFRVELGEIESWLGRHPAVREAVVLRREDPLGGARLVAYFVPAQGAEPAGPELRQFLATRLPEYMLPAAFVPLPALPLTANGKVDRAALPPPPPPAQPVVDALESDLERTIAGLWCEVLQVGKVGGHDNFFDLGGHSLALVAVHERLQAAIGVEFPLVEMFESPTTRALAGRLSSRAGHAGQEMGGKEKDLAARALKQRGATAWKERARQARRPPATGSH
jgi:amino acid adenylation domain-containing protein